MQNQEFVIRADDEKGGGSKTIEQKVPLDQIYRLLSKLVFSETMPTNMPLSACISIYNYIRYLIFPFITIDPYQQRIKIFPKAMGILPEVLKRNFLNQLSCTIFFHHVEGYSFRVVVQSCNSNDCVKIDMKFDKNSFAQMFTEHDSDSYETGLLSELIQMTNIANKGQTDSSQSAPAAPINTKQLETIYSQTMENKNPKFTLLSCRFKDYQAFINLLDQDLLSIERYLQAIGVSSFSQIAESKSIAYLSIRHLCSLKKTIFYYVKGEESGTLHVHIKNLFDSFGPMGQKIQAQGKATVEPSQLKSIFGLDFGKLDRQNKQMILEMASRMYTLFIYEKVEENLMKPSSQQAEFFLNPIQRVPLVTGGYRRQLVPNQRTNYLVPVTIQEIGTQDFLFGVRCTLHNVENQTELGVFFTANEQSWQFDNLENKKKMHLKYIETQPLTNYFCTLIFTPIITDLITQSLIIDQDSNAISIQGIQVQSTDGQIQKITDIARLETIVTSVDVAKFYMPEK